MKILFSILAATLILQSVISDRASAENSDKNGISSILINYTECPRNLQFFARDNQDSAEVRFAGSLLTLGYDSMYLEVYRNNSLHKRKGIKLNYALGTVNFSISDKIHSELSEYKFKLYLKLGIISTLIKTADSLVCGDAYIVCGQSNSHPTDPAATYSNEFCRSFGIQTPNYNYDNYNPADTNWGFSRANGAGGTWTGPYNVGVWALTLQKMIKENFGIPTCIINGGRASSTIELNLRNNNNQTDLTSIYGKLLYRVKKSGLSNKIKAIFWYQGESNGTTSWMNYAYNFGTLYNSWTENYPGFKKVFLFQTRPCCSEQYASQLREVQRKLPQSYSNIELLSTGGMPYYGGCHYSYAGYNEIAKMVYRPLAKAFYSLSDTAGMKPPNVRVAYYTTPARDEIAVLFDNSSINSWPADTLGQSMKNYFFLDGATGKVNTGVISGDTLKLKLNSSSSATRLTYLPTVWALPDSTVYLGPFMRNSRGVGALSFHDFPVLNASPTVLNLKILLDGYYNQATNSMSMRDTITVYLRENYSPYRIKDSAKAVIDSLTFNGQFTFMNINSGTYYIMIKGKSTLETWSKNGGTYFTKGTTISYDFTTAANQAYGNNMKLVGTKYCIYNSDVNQDGVITLHDNTDVFNDASDHLSGYLKTDLNGNRVVDLDDLVIAINTTKLFVSKKSPI